MSEINVNQGTEPDETTQQEQRCSPTSYSLTAATPATPRDEIRAARKREVMGESFHETVCGDTEPCNHSHATASREEHSQSLLGSPPVQATELSRRLSWLGIEERLRKMEEHLLLLATTSESRALRISAHAGALAIGRLGALLGGPQHRSPSRPQAYERITLPPTSGDDGLYTHRNPTHFLAEPIRTIESEGDRLDKKKKALEEELRAFTKAVTEEHLRAEKQKKEKEETAAEAHTKEVESAVKKVIELDMENGEANPAIGSIITQLGGAYPSSLLLAEASVQALNQQENLKRAKRGTK